MNLVINNNNNINISQIKHETEEETENKNKYGCDCDFFSNFSRLLCSSTMCRSICSLYLQFIVIIYNEYYIYIPNIYNLNIHLYLPTHERIQLEMVVRKQLFNFVYELNI